jgi:hypothetical protein
MIPDFRDDGYLPEGLHIATAAEVVLNLSELEFSSGSG